MERNWNHSPAGRRYTRRFIPAMVVYSVTIVASSLLQKHYHPQGLALTALALIPALALVASIVVIGLYFVEEKDEYLRYRLAVASLGGTGFALVFMTVWGFLEDAGQLHHLPGYWAYILWCAGMGFSQCAFNLRSLKGGGE